ncbi:uncharacterized protein DUF4435 [Neolewinella xylanilytica]|uniref:Uncharacterized protein DUF4435 n=1 Tax=Neolewinella xylanilytica TaxID=1514080 RepID=A0A2S6I8R1_9BACT|nr:DUF4435 domain-containing protein [Neolewinella xylanilytica]PPK87868.1 uncharacterized protein DUF4435 [Neolewinella xylanilytica]
MKVATLTAAKDSSVSVVLHKFYLLARKGTNVLFCFYEGKDAPYYNSRAETYYDGSYTHFNCKGKGNVLQARTILKAKPEYANYKLAFFVDQDFDEELVTIPLDLYVTTGYSIENYYCNRNTFRRVLTSEFNVNEADLEYETILTLFDDRLQKFNECVLLINSWYRFLRQEAQDKDVPINFSLDDQLPKGFVRITLDEVECDYDLNTLNIEFKPICNPTKEEINESETYLQKNDLCLVLRGKYQAQFLFTFLNLLLTDANDRNQRRFVKQKVKLTVSRTQIISQLSQYADTPESLKAFIREFN